MRNIGKNIRDARIRLGMTQDALAEKLFVTRQTVSNYETGRSHPDVEVLSNIAEALSVDIHTLIYGEALSLKQRKARRNVLLLGAVLLALFLAILLVRPHLHSLMGTYYVAMPMLWIKGVLLPVLCFLLGFGLLEAACVFLGAQIPGGRWKRVGRIVLSAFLGGCVVILLPAVIGYTYFAVYDLVAFALDKPLISRAISVFPAWDVLMGQLFFFLYRFPYASLPFGLLWRLTGMR